MRPPLSRAIRHAWLTDVITQIHLESRGTYGAPRVRAELMIGRGIVVGHNAVAMLMARAGLKGLPGDRRPRRIHETRPPVISSTVTSPELNRTSSGSPTSPNIGPEKARSLRGGAGHVLASRRWLVDR